MHRSLLLLPVAIAAVAGAPAAAQMKIGGLGYQLYKAVKDNDNGAFYQIITQNRPQLNSAVLDYVSDGETALHYAVRENRRLFVNDLLALGANPNLVSSSGDTPMTLAVGARNQDLVELLLRGRAQVDLANRRGETPLIKAVQVRDLALVDLLLKRGANPDKTDFTGRSARAYAAADTRNPALGKALADAPKASSRAVAGPKLN